MEQLIGCDAHQKFSVFVAVNEKGQAGEALRVAHDQQLYRESSRGCLRIRQSRWKPAGQNYPNTDLLKTLPGVGNILSMVLMLEIGSVDRFPTAEHLASYAGLVPRVHSSGGHTLWARSVET